MAMGAVPLTVGHGQCDGSTPDQQAAQEMPPATAAASTGSTWTAPANSLAVSAGTTSTLSPVYALINGARHSIDLTMYELSDTTAEADLAAARRERPGDPGSQAAEHQLWRLRARQLALPERSET